MSDSKYFIPANQAQVKEPVVRARFLFLDNKGLTTKPDGTPVGISYFTEIPTAYSGYVKYWNMGVSLPCTLELGEDNIRVGAWLSYDELGRGIGSCKAEAYAKTIDGGDEGDYVRVLPFIITAQQTSTFSSAFSFCQFG